MTKTRVVNILLAVAIATLSLALLSWAVTSAEAVPPDIDLVRISEETGFLAAESPLSSDCVFETGYQVYLCEPASPMRRLDGDVAARTKALELLTSDSGVLLIPDSTNKRIMTFDPISGDLIDPDFLLLDDEATGTVIHAILSPNDTVLVSDQTRNVVHEYDLAGNYLGVFAPSGGSNTAILQNIRGMALRPNGNLLVSVGSGSNAHAIAEFNAAGAYVGNFISNGSGGLSSPFDVYERAGIDWLVSSITNNLIIRYTLATRAPIGNLATINSFPQQIRQISNGNVLVANFSGDQMGVVELTSTGELVGLRTAPSVSGFRGAYELPSGTLLVSTSGGVFEIDRSGNLVDTKHSGQGRFIEWASLPSLQLRKTVGLDTSVCAATDDISVAPGTSVTYCYVVTNNTPITLTFHDLVDSHLGVLLDSLFFTVSPGASVFLTQTAFITQTTVNTATWTAYNPGPSNVMAATDVATVTVVAPSITLRKTVGLDSSACAITDAITVPKGTAVTYCFMVTNTGLTTLGRHDLVDSHLGPILDDLPFTLIPGASAFVTQTHVIAQTTVNTATWAAYNPGPTDVVAATDFATVEVEEFRVYLSLVKNN